MIGLGGTISGERGIGRKRVKYLVDFVESAQLEVMRSLKRLFDPNGVLNPGVVLVVRAEPRATALPAGRPDATERVH